MANLQDVSGPVVATGQRNKGANDLTSQLFYEALAAATGFESLDRDSVAGQILRSDPVLRENLAQGLLQHCRRAAEKGGDRRAHTVDYVLTDSEKSVMKKMYPQYLLEFTGKIRHEHAFSAATRDADERMFLDEFRGMRQSQHYDVMVKDIGGNPGRHLTRGRLNVHSCFPRLRPADQVRHTRFMADMARFRPDLRGRDSRCVYNNYLRGINLCSRVAEECRVTAPYLISVHSAYDMGREKLASAMISADANILRGSMIFHPDVLVFDKGLIPDQEMHFQRFERNGVPYIRFFHPMGGSTDYTHDYRKYIELIETIGFTHRGFDFSVEIDQMCGGRIIFTMFRHYASGVPRGVESRTIQLGHDDKLVVYYWRARDPGVGIWSFLPFVNQTRLSRVRMVVPKKLFEKMYTYATTLTEGKFVPQNIVNAGHAYNQRQVIGGTVIAERSENLSAADVVTLSHVIYLRVYMQRYVESQTMAHVKEAIDASRRHKTLWSALINFLTSPVWSVRTDVDLPQNLSLETVVAESPVPWLSTDKLLLVVEKLPAIYTIEQDIEFTGVGATIRPVFAEPEPDDDLPPEPPTDPGAPYSCTGKFVEIPVAADGNCFFHALRAVGASALDPVSLRQKLLAARDSWGLEPYLASEQVSRLTDFSEKPLVPHWADETTFLVAARVLGVTICLHMRGTVRRYGKGPVFHLQLTSEHVTGLKEYVPLPSCLSVDVSSTKTLSVPDLDDYKSRVFSSMSLKKAKTCVNAAYKYSGLGNCGYVCRSGVKLAEICYRFPALLKNVTAALDLCAGPGGFTQFLVSRGLVVSYVNCERYVPMIYRSTAAVDVSEGGGDLLDDVVFQRLTETEDMYPLVVGDGCPPGDARGVVHADDFFPLLERQVDLALTVVTIGGSYVQKFMFPQDPRSAVLLRRVARVFETVKLVRPCSTRPASDEFYVVALSHDTSEREVDVFPSLSTVACDQYEALREVEVLSRAVTIPRRVAAVADLRSALEFSPFAGGELVLERKSAVAEFYTDAFRPVAKTSLDAEAGGVIQRRLSPKLITGAQLTQQLCAEGKCATTSGSSSRKLPSPVESVARSATKLLQPVVGLKVGISPAVRFPYQKPEPSSIDTTSVYLHRPVLERVRHLPVVDILRRADHDFGSSTTFYTADSWGTVSSSSSATYYRSLSSADLSDASDFAPPTLLGVSHTLPFVSEESDFDRLVRTIKRIPPIHRSEVSEKSENVAPASLASDMVTEYLSMLRHIIATEKSNFSMYFEKSIELDFRSFATMIQHVPGTDIGYGRVVDAKLHFVVSPKNPLDYVFCFDGSDFVRVSEAEGKMVLVSELTEKFFEVEFLAKHDRVDVGDVDVKLVQAAAGCGKTTDIVRKARVTRDAVILAGTVEGREDIERRLGDSNVRVRTIQSFLLSPFVCRVLFIDEAMMQHPGMVVLAAHLSGAAEVYAYGDRCQIPFVNRARQFYVKYTNLADSFPTVAHLMRSYRCPVSVAARLHDRYLSATGVGMTSVRDQRDGEELKVITGLDAVPRAGFDVYLTFKQSEKQTLLVHGYNATTVHSFQGKEAKHVAVVRLSSNAQDEIYLREEYALVALTRHTTRLVYFTMCTTDALARLIASVPSVDKVDECLDPVAGGTYDVPDLDFLSVPVAPRGEITHDLVLTTQSVRDWKRHISTLRVDRPVAIDVRTSCDLPTFLGLARRLLRVPVFLKSAISGYAPFCVFSVMNRSGMRVCPRPVSLSLPEVDEPKVAFDVPAITTTAPVEQLQAIVNAIFPGCVYVNQDFDTLQFHSEDLNVPISNVSVLPYRDVYVPPRYDSLRPRLITSMPRRRPTTMRESLVALLKRNANVPDMAGVVDIPALVSRMFESVVAVLMKTDFDEIQLSAGDIADWLHDQPPAVAEKLLEPLGTHEMEMTSYEFMIKRDVKPDLTNNAAYTYSALQTVLSHPKTINAITCPMIRRLKERILGALPSNILFFTEVTPDEFCEKISRVIPPALSATIRQSLEVDISKYDKSQGIVALVYECRMMKFFGVPDWFVSMWFRGHIATTFSDPTTGIRGRIAFQRKSGDASTYLGNTMFLLGVLLATFKYSEMDLLLCSGDDSLILGRDFDAGVDVQDFNLIFNLETKFLRYQHYYFCSKYLFSDGQRWWLVPDPVKVMVKLGRHDLVNWEHCEEYRVSYSDNVVAYADARVATVLARAVRERYAYADVNIETLISALHVIASPDYFSSLFFTLPSDVLCHDVSRPTLDN
ncbi:RdRp [Beihai barnacle virus 2]|uniref:RdRp n=1 Tax=Beihai barnacle virus 2 TaxID=1922360 RepID=UPI00090C46D8|nr:RdRp [Beihai barnacle virus 2]APG77560.1 RdRp [Beihai barnacle virus 2]